MIGPNNIDLVHLLKLVKEDDPTAEEFCLSDIGLNKEAYARMTLLIGAMVCGDYVKIGDVEYCQALVAGEELVSFTKNGEFIHRKQMIAEWAFCWYDAYPPILISEA